MAQRNPGKLLARFRYPVEVEVRSLPFSPSTSLAYVDVAKLGRAARAEFEVGSFEAACCRMRAVGVVRRGMVTALRVEGCADCTTTRLAPEMLRIFDAAQRRMRARRRPFQPTPVAEFVNGVSPTIIEGTCSELCIVIEGYGFCVVCCGTGADRWCGIRIVVPRGQDALRT